MGDLVDKDVAVENVREVVARWYVGQAHGSAFVRPACDLIMAGVDAPAVCMVAALTAREADHEIYGLVEGFLAEVGIPYYARESPAARSMALRIMAERVVAGLISPQDLTVWVRVTFGFQFGESGELAVLDTVYETLERGTMTEKDVDVLVMAEARRITELPVISPGA